MKGNKAITTLTAVSMTATSLLSSTPIMAQNVTNEEKVTENNKQTKEQILKENLNKAKETVHEKSNVLNDSEKDYEAAKKTEAEAELVRKQQEQETLQMEQKITEDLLAELENKQVAYEDAYAKITALEKDIEKDTKELDSKVAELVVKEQELDQAKKDLEAAKEAAAVATPEAVKKAEEDLKVKQKEYDLKKAELESAKTEKEQAEVDVKAKEAVLKQKQNEKTVAQENLKVAQNNFDLASKKQQEAQSIYDATQDPELKQKAQQELDVATSELESAKAEVKKANSDLEQAKTNVTASQEVYDASVQAQFGIESKISTLESEKAALEEQRQTASAQYETVLSENKGWKENKEKLDLEIQTLQTTIDKKNEELTTLKASKTVFEKEIAQQESQLKSLEQQLKEEDKEIEKRINQGSLRFFEQMGETWAVERINKGVENGHTKIGDKTDATNLDNMQKALNQIKRGNEIRQSIGLPEWKVSHRLMAIAQVHANESQQIIDHTRNDEVAENLAFGYKDPYDGWYFEEKAYLNELVEKTPKYKQMRNEGKTDAEIIKYLYDDNFDEWLKVGHYGNVITEDYLVAGAGYTGSRPIEGEYPYDCSAWVGDFEGETAYTVENYEAMLKQYKKDVYVKPSQAQYDQLKKDLASNKVALEKVNGDILNVVSQIGNATQEKASKESERNTVSEKILVTDTQVQGLAATINDLSAQLNENTINLSKQNADLVVQKETVATNKANLETAQETLRRSKEASQNKANILEEKTSVHAQKQAKVDEIAKGEKDAKANLDAANTGKAATLTALNENKERLQLSEEALEVASLNFEEASTVNNQKAVLLENASQSEAAAKEALNAATELVDEYDTLLLNQSSASQKLEIVENAIEDNLMSQEQLTGSISTNKAQLETQKEALPSIEAPYHEAQLAQEVWNKVLAGSEDTLDVTLESLKPIAANIETYKSLRTVLKEKTEKVNQLKVATELKRSDYVKAKKDFMEAKELAEKIEKDLTQYLVEQKKQEEIKKAEEAKKEQENKKKTESVETGFGLDLGFYQSLTAIAAAGFTVSLIKSKRKD